MDYPKINSLASRGIELPKSVSLPDILCYEALIQLKREYDEMGLEIEEARLRKQKIRKAYEKYLEAYRNYLDGMKDYQQNIKRAGELRVRIIQEPDPAVKLNLALECIGVMTGDTSFTRLAGPPV